MVLDYQQRVLEFQREDRNSIDTIFTGKPRLPFSRSSGIRRNLRFLIETFRSRWHEPLKGRRLNHFGSRVRIQLIGAQW
jgi:hypothetical protein